MYDTYKQSSLAALDKYNKKIDDHKIGAVQNTLPSDSRKLKYELYTVMARALYISFTFDVITLLEW